MRRRRITEVVQLRKANKDKQLLKRRNVDIGAEDATSPEKDDNAQPLMDAVEIMQGMMSTDEEVQFKATLACRKILSAERNPPIDQMIRIGVVPKCVEFLSRNHK